MMVVGVDFSIGGILVTDARKVSHEGNHAAVWRGNVNGKQVIVKEHPLGGIAPDVLMKNWQAYRKQVDSLATQTGIQSLPTIAFEASNDQKRIRFVDQMAEYPDVSYSIGRPGSVAKKMALLAKLLRSFCAIPYDGQYRTEYMLDGEFSNFCPNGNGGFDYVDLFPAHIRQPSTGLLEANDEHRAGTRSIALETFLTGDTYGIVGRFWGMLRRDQPALWKLAPINPTMKRALLSIPSELKNYSEYLFETDTKFMQDVYSYGLRDKKSMRLHGALVEWRLRDTMPPPELLK
jgi:hypothetical protein